MRDRRRTTLTVSSMRGTRNEKKPFAGRRLEKSLLLPIDYYISNLGWLINLKSLAGSEQRSRPPVCHFDFEKGLRGEGASRLPDFSGFILSTRPGY